MNGTKTLTLVAIIAVALAAFNLIITMDKVGELTGYASDDEGNATLEIVESIDIRFDVNLIEWGSGYVNTTLGTNATLDTLGNNARWVNQSGYPVTQGLVLENVGNVNASIDLSSSDNAATFIGGFVTPPEFQWNITNNETGSCEGGVLIADNVWADVSTSPVTVCNKLLAGPLVGYDQNSLLIDLRILIPSDAGLGTRTATITAQGATA